MAKPAPGALEVTQAARRFIVEYLGETPLGLSGLGEDDFKKCMDAIVRTMYVAYVEGHRRGIERRP